VTRAQYTAGGAQKRNELSCHLRGLTCQVTTVSAGVFASQTNVTASAEFIVHIKNTTSTGTCRTPASRQVSSLPALIQGTPGEASLRGGASSAEEQHPRVDMNTR
jgi:hypothetical protein